MAALLPRDWSARRHEDLAAALALLGMLQRSLDVLDRVNPLDGRRQHALQDLAAEVGVDRADLLERAVRERATEDEADEHLSTGDQRGPRHDGILAGHRSVVADDPALAEACGQPRRCLARHGVETETDRSAGGSRLHGLGETG